MSYKCKNCGESWVFGNSTLSTIRAVQESFLTDSLDCEALCKASLPVRARLGLGYGHDLMLYDMIWGYLPGLAGQPLAMEDTVVTEATLVLSDLSGGVDAGNAHIH